MKGHFDHGGSELNYIPTLHLVKLNVRDRGHHEVSRAFSQAGVLGRTHGIDQIVCGSVLKVDPVTLPDSFPHLLLGVLSKRGGGGGVGSGKPQLRIWPSPYCLQHLGCGRFQTGL